MRLKIYSGNNQSISWCGKENEIKSGYLMNYFYSHVSCPKQYIEILNGIEFLVILINLNI